MAVDHRDAIAVRTDAQARIDKTLAIPFAEQLLRLGFHLSSSPLMKGTTFA